MQLRPNPYVGDSPIEEVVHYEPNRDPDLPRGRMIYGNDCGQIVSCGESDVAWTSTDPEDVTCPRCSPAKEK